jgi:hypothetical protein
LLPALWDYIEKASKCQKALSRFACFNKPAPLSCYCLLILFPLSVMAQQPNGVNPIKDTTKRSPANNLVTRVSGRVTDSISGQPLQFISIRFTGGNYGAASDKHGEFNLSAPGTFYHVTFSHIGYQAVTRTIKPGQLNELRVRLQISQNTLKEVSVRSQSKHYRNKGNPAVELIQQVIDHKDQNRMESSDYLQYDQYERVSLSMFNLPRKIVNGRIFSTYKFMLDTTLQVNGKTETALPVYFSEKLSQNYYRKNPEKTIKVVQAQKDINIVKFIDTVGVSIYLNRLYGNDINIYDNNIFIITNQFLSPIADHAPNYYQFFITDTIRSGKDKLVEISFTPRNKGDLLFEGKLLVTMDGRYAVQSCEMGINRQININFLRSLKIHQDFQQYPNGRFYLHKSEVKTDFGILRNKGTAVFGDRTVFFSNYKLNSPMPAFFYDGKSLQTVTGYDQLDTAYWAHHRTDTLSAQQAMVYAHINKLEAIPSFKRASWIAATLSQGYANLGPVQFGPIGAFYSFSTIEGSRFQVGGRTTPQLNKTIYLEGYAAYGTKDERLKYDFSTYFSLNKLPYYQFPNDYFEVSYLYDVNVPGQSFSINNTQAALVSFHTGKINYFLYNRIYSLSYVKDFENHFSYNLTLKNWEQQAAGTLVYQLNDANNSIIQNLTTREAELGLRFAPNEQIIQGTFSRRTILSKYPIFNLTVKYGSTGIFTGTYKYANIGASIYKRFYMSQLGYSDFTLMGGIVAGKAPFPLLNISPANQSLGYTSNAYNAMNYLEFVSDHYAGINFTQNFNGFFLNKIPLIDRLKWREFLSFKILYGGLRNENNPLYSANLFKLPTTSNGTYSLGSVPYTEAGAGIGNIFKLLRVDVVRRFNYLDHPGVSPYVIKFSINPDF